MDFRSRYNYDPKTDFVNKGGFARVFKAYDNVLDRQVALKVYSQEASNKYDLIADMKRGSRLDHPNLCRYFDVAVLKGVTAMGEEETLQVGVMEFLDGGNIKQYIGEHPHCLTKLLLDVLQGLSYLHQSGIIHRDLTPANVLVKNTTAGPAAKITDFGISKVVDSTNTKSSELLGKVEYMAPEQFNPQKYGINGKIGYNLDLWSFGCLTYELIKEESLFGSRQDLGTEQVILKILDEVDHAKITALPEPFRTVVQRCLVKDANKRVKKAGELIDIISGKALNVLSPSTAGKPKANGETRVITPLSHGKQRSHSESGETLVVGGGSDGSPTPSDGSSPIAPTPEEMVANLPEPMEQTRPKRFGIMKVAAALIGLPLLGLLFLLLANRNKADAYFPPSSDYADSTSIISTTASDTSASSTTAADSSTYTASGTSSKDADKIATKGTSSTKEISKEKTSNTLNGLTDIYGDKYNYKGDIVDGLPHGYGTAKYKSGEKYVGNFVHGYMSGQGTYTYQGDKYVGEWDNDKKNGFGKYTAAEGREVSNCPNCKYYVGNYVDNEKSGFGRCYDEDGNLLFEGYFENNKPIGVYPNQ